MQPTPDDKDWTWVLERPCPECGFDAAALPLNEAGERLWTAVQQLQQALTRPDARARPDPTTWSPLEYACHVRDTCVVFDDRILLVQTEDHPTFANWDQDATAVERRYAEQQPDVVSAQLQTAVVALLDRLQQIPDAAWQRPARRSNGSRFTLETLVRYLVHDPVHHAHDVGFTPLP